jgi:molybdate transport system substrate-binding protein
VTKVELAFGGPGTVLSRMEMSKTGDLFIPSSPDYVNVVKDDGAIRPETMRIIAYLKPPINVPK